jgi:hypothetical protein
MEYPNWFDVYARDYFEHHLLPLAGNPDLRFLQVGAFTGDASVWLADNVLTGAGSSLTDVDTWAGSDEPEHEKFDWADVERTYDANVWLCPVDKFRGTSETFFRSVPARPLFDFIYIDGDHTSFGVLNDAVNAYHVLKPGGMLAFDDYLWQSHSGDPLDCPAPAVNAVKRLYKGRLECLPDAGEPAQVWFRKVAA